MKPVKIASAAANVGSSRFAAGVPVLDRDRLVDLPKDPVSAAALLVRDTGLPSLLSLSEKIFMLFCCAADAEAYPGNTIA